MDSEVILAICKRLVSQSVSQSVNNTGLRDASASKKHACDPALDGEFFCEKDIHESSQPHQHHIRFKIKESKLRQL